MRVYHKINNTNKKMRQGSTLADAEAHQLDHNRWSRRNFLRNMGITGGMSMLLGNLPIAATATSPLSQALNNSETDRVLVLIRLKGGNDGLNTIIPYRNDVYYKKRPTLAIGKEEVLKVGEELGFNPSLVTVDLARASDVHLDWLDLG